MSNEIKFADIESALESEGRYVGMTSGVSMLPMIKSGKDVVVIRKKGKRLGVFDVALYKRSENTYVLHRVIALTDTGYIIRGDNCYENESVDENSVIGVLETYFKGEKQVDLGGKKYLNYVKKRISNYPVRKFFYVTKQKIKRALKKIVRGKRNEKR